MAVVYLDNVMLLNALMDYLLCLITARLAGIPLQRRRYAIAALVGGVYGAALFFPGGAWLASVPAKLLFGILMAWIAYRRESCFLRLTLLFFVVSCAMGGCVLAAGLLAEESAGLLGTSFRGVPLGPLLIAAAVSGLVLQTAFRSGAAHGIRGDRLPVRVCIDGKTVEFAALWDSGNDLRDPMSGQPLLVVAFGGLNAILPSDIRQLISREGLGKPSKLLEPIRTLAPHLRPLLIPYQAVGVSSGFLLAVRTDWIEIDGILYPGMQAVLSPTALGTSYIALWGGERRRVVHHGNSAQSLASSAPAAGAASAHPLHRWK